MALGDGFGNLLGITNNVAQSPFDQSQARMEYELLKQAQAAQAQQPGVYTTPMPNLHERAREMFLKRLGGLRAEHKVKLGDFIAAHVHGTTVYLFYVFDGREGVVKEDIDLFPSDQLITQFRMILA